MEVNWLECCCTHEEPRSTNYFCWSLCKSTAVSEEIRDQLFRGDLTVYRNNIAIENIMILCAYGSWNYSQLYSKYSGLNYYPN